MLNDLSEILQDIEEYIDSDFERQPNRLLEELRRENEQNEQQRYFEQQRLNLAEQARQLEEELQRLERVEQRYQDEMAYQDIVAYQMREHERTSQERVRKPSESVPVNWSKEGF